MKLKLKHLAAALVLAGLTVSSAHASKDVVVALYSSFTTTDPYDANDTVSQAVAKSFYQGLYSFDKDMKMVPVLAESNTVSKDGLVYTIKLKKGIKFHDGTDFNAEAVKVTFDRVTNPDNKLKRYNLYKNIAKTEVVDPSTVRFTLTADDLSIWNIDMKRVVEPGTFTISAGFDSVALKSATLTVA